MELRDGKRDVFTGALFAHGELEGLGIAGAQCTAGVERERKRRSSKTAVAVLTEIESRVLSAEVCLDNGLLQGGQPGYAEVAAVVGG